VVKIASVTTVVTVMSVVGRGFPAGGKSAELPEKNVDVSASGEKIELLEIGVAVVVEEG
jgi:hypothetical protein